MHARTGDGKGTCDLHANAETQVFVRKPTVFRTFPLNPLIIIIKGKGSENRRFSDLDGRNEFPVQLPAYLLPDLILFNALLAILQHGKIRQELALVQQLA